jgi:hypothetical protein
MWSKRTLIQNLGLNSMMFGCDSVKVPRYFVFSWSEKLATPVAQRLDRVLRPTNSARKVILYLLFALVKYHKRNVFSVCFHFCFSSEQCCES